MAWEARSGLKQQGAVIPSDFKLRLNGLGSPFGIETTHGLCGPEQSPWLNGLGSPFEGRK